MAAGNSVLLLDSESQCFYIKSTDTSGMPQPLRIFDYTERTADIAEDVSRETYATKDEVAELLERIKKLENRRKPKMEVVEVSEDA